MMIGNGNDKKKNSGHSGTSGVANIHSNSELDELYLEQLNIQRQLDTIQKQQQQLQEQQQLIQSQTQEILGRPGIPSRSISRSPTMSLSRSTSNLSLSSPRFPKTSTFAQDIKSSDIRGHPLPLRDGPYSSSSKEDIRGRRRSVPKNRRRQSLILEEAKKAAAEEQEKRNQSESSYETPPKLISKHYMEEFNLSSVEKTCSSKAFITPSTSPIHLQEYSLNSSTSVRNSEPRTKFVQSYASVALQGISQISPTAPYKFPQPPSTGHHSFNTAKDDNDNINQMTIHSFRAEATSRLNSNDNEEPPSMKELISSPINFHRSSKSLSSPIENTSRISSPRFRRRRSSATSDPNYLDIDTQFQYPSYIQQPGTGHSRKPLFTPYVPQMSIPELLKEGKLVTGIVRVNKKNRSDAWVSTEGLLDSDIYICGSKDRNRALEGDFVGVELLPVDDVWESKKVKEEKKKRKDASIQQTGVSLSSSEDYHNDASSILIPTNSIKIENNNESILNESENLTKLEMGNRSTSVTGSLRRRSSLKYRPTQKKNDDLEVEGQSLLLVEEEEINNEFKPLYAGHIVAILDRVPGQLFTGTLSILRPSQLTENNMKPIKPNHQPKIIWFKPTDKKVPLIAIPTELVPKDFIQNNAKYENKLFIASIKRWPITSLHPFGILIAELGKIDDPNIEIDSIFRDNNFPGNEYSDQRNTVKEKPILLAKSISKELLKDRVDFTDLNTYNVLAISTSDNLSEFAVHVKDNSDGTLELACHVIDITAHIEEGGSVDRRARRRSTGVIMPQEKMALLPKAVNDAVSLFKDKKSATISIIFKLDSKSFKVISSTICESIIAPSLLLDVDDIVEDLMSKEVNPYLSLLAEISRCFYSERMHSPDIALDPLLSILSKLDDEDTEVNLNIFETNMGNFVVNELQRKCNSIIAESLLLHIGDPAFLRRQLPPSPIKLKSFVKKVKRYGYDIDSTSPENIIKSILSINDPITRKGVEVLFYKTMSRAKYFIKSNVENNQYEHYLNNFPVYTHFTSPLRRYSDHVVHRQLKSIIHDDIYNYDFNTLRITAEYCNFKKDCAYQAQTQAIHLLLSKCINSMSNGVGQLLTMGTVLQVYESSFDVIIPEFGLEKRVHGDQLPLFKAEFDELKRELYLYWKPGVDSADFIPPDEKSPQSYRNSIKNKFKSSTKEIIKHQINKLLKDKTLLTEDMIKELEKMNCKEPKLSFPFKFPGLENNSEDKLELENGEAGPIDIENALKIYRNTTIIKKDEKLDGNKDNIGYTDSNYIQIINESQTIPILLRAEVGLTLPCISVRAFNPFYKRDE
ncbi:hypothetical protein TBLA_0C03280 [Henningerozyma blattae CBS 6284]|uniref:RNB domain-containing protein n=1 Tax=Henningerozyma blattae (strain ATCC 34711 / CBS 6284 / DSM 70876 / NBRC 10599 / NRRL Y-10934 / UCD 77-7) TaxID=1071380 RepID=I2H180_HENB6|nr:hypothetical protein TBLA_0C03280 [Tetrapisispora blattae CBS 6284]CCH60132.1 hypothetical protein TBLA_0C03280 [Tetrapisispora blattae CBS 6284]